MVKLGRIGIATEMSMLSSHNAFPRERNFVAALNIMCYLKGKHNSCLDLDPTYPEIVHDKLESVEEAIPLNTPTPLSKSVELWMMVDSDYAGDNTNMRSHYGFMIFSNLALIY